MRGPRTGHSLSTRAFKRASTRLGPYSGSPMEERFAKVGDIELCYETFGDPGSPAILLIMGLGTQMIAWPEEFCRVLAAQGFFVIRYDNRDVGRSTHLDGAPTPRQWEMLRRRPKRVAYSLADMAQDGLGLLDALGIE